ncbi:hypothetical protein JRO89_XS13G0050200 [Xanthoceras sorbifolium]|uniref:Cytochrome P450 n=1 Tax=Xanthoceras sorbifolium TaxID=99658 RepID=A0ABQ8H6L1_9ROSI|nr:hypothetical protein JRO89_XS13G0050200 [Xanthoceras sorbifolium]
MAQMSSYLQHLQSCLFNTLKINSNERFLFSFCAIFAVLWYTWMYTKSKRGGSPPYPPGPRGLPLVGNLPFLDPELHTYFATLARDHGPIFKLWLGNKLGIVVSSSALACQVLKDQDTTFANRDVTTAALAVTYGGRDIAWNPYGPEWRMLRKVCVLKMLSNTTLDSVYELRRRQLRETVGDERSNLGAEFREVVSEMTELLGAPNLSDFYPCLARFDLQGVVKRMNVLAMKFDKIFDVLIDQRLRIDGEGGNKAGDNKECKDFLQFLLQLKNEGDSKTPLTMIHVKALLMLKTPLVAIPTPRLSDPALYQ